MILTHDGYIAQVTFEEGDEFMHGTTVNTRAGSAVNACAAAGRAGSRAPRCGRADR